MPHQRWLYVFADCPVGVEHSQQELERELARFVRLKGRRVLGMAVADNRVVVYTTRGRIPKEPVHRRYTSGRFPIVVAYRESRKGKGRKP